MRSSYRRVRIARKTIEALDIFSFELVDPDGNSLPPFSAGSHIDVQVGNDKVRQYSLCNDPSETHRYLIAVLREANSRGGSVAMHAFEEGQLLEISDPRCHFMLEHDMGHSLLFGGGIGVTPILCMAERLSNIGASFEMHYCTRSPNRTAFAERIRNSAFADCVRFHHDDGPESQKLDVQTILVTAPTDTHLYICGPTGFIDWVLSNAREIGWPENRLHREYFAAVPFDTSHDGSFEIQVASTGAVIRVAADQSVVSALANVGIEVPMSCEQGVCGTCLTRVLEGTPLHRDMYLTPEEQAKCDLFTPCCSRASSARLVLDL